MASSSKLVDSASRSSLPQQSRDQSCGDSTSSVRAVSSVRHRLPSSNSGRNEYWRTPLGSTPPLRVACSRFPDDQSSTTSSTDTKSTTSEIVTPPSAVTRVLAVDPNAGRCLLTDATFDIQFAYCLPRDLDPIQLDNLESAWNMKPGSLNTDSRYNILPLTRRFRQLFEAGECLLVPTAQIIEVYHANRAIPVGADFPDIPNGVFEYTLLSCPSLKDISIHRSSPLQSIGAAQHPEGVITHSYPFEKLGTLCSHLHPRFVICDLGRKINQAGVCFQETLGHLYDAHAFDLPSKYELLSQLLDARRVYEKWTTQCHVPPYPQPNVAIAPSISSSQQTRRKRAIPPSASATSSSGQPRLTKRNLKALQDSSKDDFAPWDVIITRWRTFCELASCADDECDIDPDELGDDEDNCSEYDVEMDAADLEMGSSDATIASADVEMAVIGDGVGDDGPQPETLYASDTCPTPVLHACSMPPPYAEAPSPPPSRHDTSSPPPRDASSPPPRDSSSPPSRNTTLSSSSVSGPATPPPASYYTLARGSSKSCKRAFADMACEDNVEDQREPGVPSKRTRIGF